MNLHPDAHAPFSERHQMIERNLRSIRDILPLAKELGVGLMLENLPGSFNTVEEMSDLLDPVPELGLHLDIGHGNLMSHSNTADELIETYASRLRHVHIHDNKGGTADLHLPLGAGNIDVLHFVKKLQSVNYDAAITLEVFSQDRRLLGFSREVLRDLWEQSLQTSASGASLKQ